MVQLAPEPLSPDIDVAKKGWYVCDHPHPLPPSSLTLYPPAFLVWSSSYRWSCYSPPCTADRSIRAHLSTYSSDDWRDLKKISIIFLPLFIFWALDYQQNSTWVDQADDMNTAIIWNTPDVTDGFEDVTVCLFVPLFEVVRAATCCPLASARREGCLGF